jgi:hypothetical protein
VQRDHMSNEALNVIAAFIVFLTTISTAITFNYQIVVAQFDNSNDNSILPNYREGYEVGKVQGSKDNISGNEHNDGCPPEGHNILWCIGFEIGYNDGYYNTLSIEENATKDF